jgi:hypothetical protein
MLEVLRFKKSVFAGVLDGGESSVFLGGSRLTKFMENIENVTTSIPAAPVAEAHEREENADAVRRPGRPAPSEAPTPAAEPWAGLLQAGMSLLGQLSETKSAGGGRSLVRRDAQTGQDYLHLPLPPPEVLTNALQALEGLLRGMKGAREEGQ